MSITRRELLATATIVAVEALARLEAVPQRPVATDERTQWNAIYTAGDCPYRTEHNLFLADVIKGRAPGAAVIENFARDVNQPARVGGGPLGYSTNQLLTLYSALRIRRYEDTTSVADWGRQGRAVPVMRLAAEKLA